MSENYKNLFNEMEIDAIGEILNISLGSSATAVSDMLERRVEITTPKVYVKEKSEFEIQSYEPAIGVEITYVEGLEGSNVMVLKRKDVKSILEILMHTEIEEDDFELDELSISAVCEVMNQMMGASATALADFLGSTVNISTPVSFEITDSEEFKSKYFHPEEAMVVICFKLDIENCMSSEFMTLMGVPLAKKLISSFGLSDDAADGINFPGHDAISADVEDAAIPDSGGGNLSEDAIAALLGGGMPELPASDSGSGNLSEDAIAALLGGGTPEIAPQPQMQPMQPQQQMQPQQPMQPMQMQQPMQPQQPMQQPMQMQQPMYQQPMQPIYANIEPRIVNMQPIARETRGVDIASLPAAGQSNLDLIMQVPLQVSVEIGRTKKKVKEILEFTKGTLVVLDKMAGDQIDIYVNGQVIAKGDVVVVDDSFGVRITEIVKGHELLQNKDL